MVSKQLSDILGLPPRRDGTQIVGDMGGMPNISDNSATPCREPIHRLPSLGPNGPAQIGPGDMVSGAEFAQQPSLGVVEKVPDSRSQLPQRLGGEP